MNDLDYISLIYDSRLTCHSMLRERERVRERESEREREREREFQHPPDHNLHTWGKKASNSCFLCCEATQSLTHVLNNFPVAMELRHYSRRYNDVLELIGIFIHAHLPNDFSITIDSPSFTYSFPQHIIPTDLCPNI